MFILNFYKKTLAVYFLYFKIKLWHRNKLKLTIYNEENMSNEDNNKNDNTMDKHEELRLAWKRLKDIKSDEEFQKEFDRLLKEQRKATDDWFRVAMFGERQRKKED